MTLALKYLQRNENKTERTYGSYMNWLGDQTQRKYLPKTKFM